MHQVRTRRHTTYGILPIYRPRCGKELSQQRVVNLLIPVATQNRSFISQLGREPQSPPYRHPPLSRICISSTARHCCVKSLNAIWSVCQLVDNKRPEDLYSGDMRNLSRCSSQHTSSRSGTNPCDSYWSASRQYCSKRPEASDRDRYYTSEQHHVTRSARLGTSM